MKTQPSNVAQRAAVGALLMSLGASCADDTETATGDAGGGGTTTTATSGAGPTSTTAASTGTSTSSTNTTSASTTGAGGTAGGGGAGASGGQAAGGMGGSGGAGAGGSGGAGAGGSGGAGAGGAGGAVGTGGVGGSGGSSSTGGGGGSGGSGGSGGNGGSGGSGGNGGSGGSGGAAPPSLMTFFVSSVGNGVMGANFGGIAGADLLCQNLANATGTTRTWHAYLSTTTEDARNRIGTGPWVNVNGVLVATDAVGLHNAGLLAAVLLTETGASLGVAQHDILTGSTRNGTYSGFSCADYTVNDPNNFVERASVGHSDTTQNNQFENWNSVHESNGCSLTALQATAGEGHLYCFAID